MSSFLYKSSRAAAGLSDGPTPRSRRPTGCVKFLVSGLNSAMERVRGANSWRLKREREREKFYQTFVKQIIET